MEIYKFPHPSLLRPCKKVAVFTPELKVLLESMWETMKAAKGIGLAANQVGLEYRMFVMEGPDMEKLFIINPEIKVYSKVASPLKEGCLSAPGEALSLYRPSWVMLSFYDENGEHHERVFSDIYAVCIFHEMDHVNGESYLLNKAIPKKIRISLAKKYGLRVK